MDRVSEFVHNMNLRDKRNVLMSVLAGVLVNQFNFLFINLQNFYFKKLLTVYNRLVVCYRCRCSFSTKRATNESIARVWSFGNSRIYHVNF